MYGFYEVKPGDQLFKILRDAYGTGEFLDRKNEMVQFVLANNPGIKDINRIYPGQIIMLPLHEDPDRRVCSVVQLPPVADATAVEKLGLIPSTLKRMSGEGRALAGTFGVQTLQNGGTTFIDAVGKSVTKAIPELRRIPLEYFRKEAGTSTVGRYNYVRSKSIRTIESKLGFLEPLVFNTKKATEVLRVDRHAPNRIHQYVKTLDGFERIGKVAKYAKYGGGAVLKAIDIGVAVDKYRMAEKKEDKIGIVADWAGSVGTALAFSLLVATPVGWTGLVVVAVAAAAASMAGGAVVETLAEGVLADNWQNPVAQLID